MIDEKKLIEDMMNNDGIDFRMDFNTATEDSVLESLREFADKFRQGMIELVQKQPKVGEWIPCSKRLPENEKLLYWTTHEDGTVMLHGWLKTNGFIYNWEVDDLEKRKRMGQVVAWMPIFEPEPYKE